MTADERKAVLDWLGYTEETWATRKSQLLGEVRAAIAEWDRLGITVLKYPSLGHLNIEEGGR